MITLCTDVSVYSNIACVASVSVRFRSKERVTGVKDHATNGASKRTGRGWERKKSFSCPSPLLFFLAFVLFLARSKPKIPFLGLSLIRNLKKTLATQANSNMFFLTVDGSYSNKKKQETDSNLQRTELVSH